MEAATTEKAAKKRSPEKRLATPGALPVGQPGSKEEVSDKCESEDKSRNEKQDTYLHHRKEEKRKYYKPKSAIRNPSICILGIHPGDIGPV
jgi:hypothetical protein